MKLEQMHSLSIDILNQLGQLKKMVEDNKIELIFTILLLLNLLLFYLKTCILILKKSQFY